MYWKHRHLLLKTFESLLEQRGIVDDLTDGDRGCFRRIQQAEQDRFAHALKEFLRVFAPETSWILDIPAIFEDVTELGIRFAKIKLYYGVT